MSSHPVKHFLSLFPHVSHLAAARPRHKTISTPAVSSLSSSFSQLPHPIRSYTRLRVSSITHVLKLTPRDPTARRLIRPAIYAKIPATVSPDAGMNAPQKTLVLSKYLSRSEHDGKPPPIHIYRAKLRYPSRTLPSRRSRTVYPLPSFSPRFHLFPPKRAQLAV